jgi:DNA-3-methyladenine glycosylase II
MKHMLQTFSSNNFHTACDTLASGDADLEFVIQTYGYPPMWTRPNSFETLVHIILEQQVSLASARSALNKLQEQLTVITPAKVLLLTDEIFKACYFSRQKTGYVKHLAAAILNNHLSLPEMEKLPDNEVRATLIQLKGIGNWTIDVYLMFVLQRADIFPAGDLAAVNALKQLKKLPKETSRESVLQIAGAWQPYRTVATMILWHYYLSVRVKK